MPVLVIGAAGAVGRLTTAALRERGAEVVALAEPGDEGDAGALRAAAEGCEAVLLLTPHTPGQVAAQNAAVDAAADVGARLVKVSSWGPAVRQDSPVPGARRDWITHQYLLRRGLPYTVLQPDPLMQSLIGEQAADVRERGVLVDPVGGRGIGMVDARDVAEVAARVLTEPGHEGRTYRLGGSAPTACRDIAGLLSGLTARRVRCRELLPEEVAPWLARRHGAGEEAEGGAALFALLRAGAGDPSGDDVVRIAHRAPRGVEEFLKDHLHDFLPGCGEASR
ncbi:SDR family oxidoreductase [Streptomyces sp. NPDC060028]|uniref:SDR family oxidoreductase n=1 Tax=Streptomyces sp. NPDC060028 TaxID=3347041 RepID=UPI0036856BA4